MRRACRNSAHRLLLVACILAGGGLSVAQEPEASPEADLEGIVLFGIEADDVPAFFRANPCFVGALTDLTPAEEGWTARISYVSTNHGGDDRRHSVVFPHAIELVPSDPPAPAPDALDLESTAVVLVAAGDEPFTYRLVGTTPLESGGEWDFFATRPELWLEQEGGGAPTADAPRNAPSA